MYAIRSYYVEYRIGIFSGQERHIEDANRFPFLDLVLLGPDVGMAVYGRHPYQAGVECQATGVVFMSYNFV